MERCLGVVGGMGPLVSAEFVRTIYEFGVGGREQEAPRVLLYSDPTFPDRTTALGEGRGDVLVPPLVKAIQFLIDAGAAEVVIACVTVHEVLEAVPSSLRSRVRSLVDVVVDELTASRERHLMLASTGTRRSRLFERHPRWSAVANRVAMPDDGDQERIHKAIYRLKSNEDAEQVVPLVEELLRKYGVRSFIAACTEIHFLTKRMAVGSGATYGALDPLLVVARDAQARFGGREIREQATQSV